jgi:tyrosinase
MATIRKNEARLSTQEWTAFIAALEATHGIGATLPPYRNFVRVHVNAMDSVGMAWGVHTMEQHGMVGRNFLAWHRRYLFRFEQRLQQVDPTVAIPYWNWIANPRIPEPLNTRQFVRSWAISRDWDPGGLPTQRELNVVTARTQFPNFQRFLESIHGWVHGAVGGTMNTSSSPSDPIFWLHHAMIDRIWALWQRTHQAATPPNMRERLQPSPLITGTVESVVSVSQLGYRYA